MTETEVWLPKLTQLRSLAQKVTRCQKCKLFKTRKRTVFGHGDPDAELMLVGEAPGRDEDEQGLPFVGRAGKKLDDMLASIGRKREHCYIANTVKCRPPSNRNPEEQETEECLPYLHRQIEIIKPRVILAMGQFAIRAFVEPYFSTVKSSRKLNENEKKRPNYNGIPVVATYHPAYILRDPGREHLFIEDLSIVEHLIGESRKVSTGFAVGLILDAGRNNKAAERSSEDPNKECGCVSGDEEPT